MRTEFNLELAENITKIAAHTKDIILNRCGAENVTQKRVHDWVTSADKNVQDLIRTLLKESYPDYAFFGEEGENKSIDPSVPTWVVDPIDGTTNFIRDYGVSCVSIALVLDGKSRISVIYNPYKNLFFTAAEGYGAYRSSDGAKLHVSDVEWNEAIVFMGTMPYDKSDLDGYFDIWKGIFSQTSDLRRSGSAALDLTQLAEGKGDAFCERGLGAWDFAAASLLIREAGGMITDWAGNDLVIKEKYGNIVAGTPKTIDHIIKCVSKQKTIKEILQ